MTCTTHTLILANLPAIGSTVTVEGVEGTVRAVGVQHRGEANTSGCLPSVILRDGRRVVGTSALYLA